MIKLDKQMVIVLLIGFLGTAIFFEASMAEETVAPQQVTLESEKMEYKSEGLKDPFEEEKIEIKEEPQQGEAKPLPPLQIQGIVWGGNFPQAIINNRVLRSGDTIEGARITDIAKSGITIFFDNRRYNLPASSSVNPQALKNNP
jgi:hypothetical protein